MSVLLCPARLSSSANGPRGPSALGPVGQAIFAMCSAPGASGEAASSQDVLPCTGAGVSARIGSIECGPARDVTANNGCRKGYGRRAFPRSRLCVRQRARWIYRTWPRSQRQPRTRIAGRISPRWCASTETGYPRRPRGFWKCARQVELISIRLLASAGQVCSIRVCGAGLRTSTTGLRSPVPRHFAQ